MDGARDSATAAHPGGTRRDHFERWRRLLPALSLALALAGCAAVSPEPANLSPHKQQIRAYVDSGRYIRDLDAVAARARTWIESRAAQGGVRLTVVFDLDETLLFNWPYVSAMDFGYVHREWDRWVEKANAPAIASVLAVYRTARERGIDVMIVTGRTESTRAATERNLRAIACSDYTALICRPDDDKSSNADFKTRIRKRLAHEGRTIIANLGDQESDLAGGFSERTFKLPNVFYLTD